MKLDEIRAEATRIAAEAGATFLGLIEDETPAGRSTDLQFLVSGNVVRVPTGLSMRDLELAADPLVSVVEAFKPAQPEPVLFAAPADEASN